MYLIRFKMNTLTVTYIQNFWYKTQWPSRMKFATQATASVVNHLVRNGDLLWGVNTYHAIIKCKYTNIATMVYMISAHNRISIIFNPYPCQSVPTDFVIFVSSLSIICYIKTNIFTITDITVTYNRICTNTTYANGSSNCIKTKTRKSYGLCKKKALTDQLMYF